MLHSVRNAVSVCEPYHARGIQVMEAVMCKDFRDRMKANVIYPLLAIFSLLLIKIIPTHTCKKQA